jgi:hypothetical protein
MAIFATIAMFSFGLSLLALFSTRLFNEMVSFGLCPECSGEGKNHVLQNGLEGCPDCSSKGTLAAYNKTRAYYGRKPLQ